MEAQRGLQESERAEVEQEESRDRAQAQLHRQASERAEQERMANMRMQAEERLWDEVAKGATRKGRIRRALRWSLATVIIVVVVGAGLMSAAAMAADRPALSPFQSLVEAATGNEGPWNGLVSWGQEQFAGVRDIFTPSGEEPVADNSQEIVALAEPSATPEPTPLLVAMPTQALTPMLAAAPMTTPRQQPRNFMSAEEQDRIIRETYPEAYAEAIASTSDAARRTWEDAKSKGVSANAFINAWVGADSQQYLVTIEQTELVSLVEPHVEAPLSPLTDVARHYVDWSIHPKVEGDILEFAGSIQERSLQDWTLCGSGVWSNFVIYSWPPPQASSVQGTEPVVGSIFEPLSPSQYYQDLAEEEVVADLWNVDCASFHIRAKVSSAWPTSFRVGIWAEHQRNSAEWGLMEDEIASVS